MEGVHNHAGVGDALRRELALVVTEAKAELGRQAMPEVLGASGLAAKWEQNRQPPAKPRQGVCGAVFVA